MLFCYFYHFFLSILSSNSFYMLDGLLLNRLRLYLFFRIYFSGNYFLNFPVFV
jgi:hypothetical protein